MNPPQPLAYRFAGYRLEPVSRQLIAADGRAIALTAKAFDVLLHLIEHRERVVGKDELLAAVWHGRVVEENNLTQAVSTLRRALGTGAGEHRYIVTVPGRGYRFVAELEPLVSDSAEALPGKPEVAPPATTRPSLLGRRGSFVLAATVLVALLLATTALRKRPTLPEHAARSGSPPPTLAVLPFRSIGDGAETTDELLQLGMAETLIARLSRSTSLRVLSLNSVQGFTGATTDPMRAGMTLGADYIIEGSTQHRGNSIRVNARLMSLPGGRTVWAGTFDQTPDKVFTLQDALADGMSAALSLHDLGAAHHSSPCDGEDARAYRAYLRGRHLMNRPDRYQLPKAIDSLRQAVDLDPLCARAWAGMAFAYRSLAMTADRDPRETFPLAKAAIAKALAIDPRSAEAYASKGFIEFWYDWNWAAAEKSLRHAVALNGNLSESHFALAHLLVNLGRFDEAGPYARKAALLDPLSPVINSIAAQLVGSPDEASRRLEKVLELDPDFWIALHMRGNLALATGNVAAALRDVRRADELCGVCSHTQATLVRALVEAGDRDAAERILARMESRDRESYVPATRLALAHLALGRRERALDLLERAYADRDINMSFLAIDGRWQDLHREPRFQALLQRMNLELPEDS